MSEPVGSSPHLQLEDHQPFLSLYPAMSRNIAPSRSASRGPVRPRPQSRRGPLSPPPACHCEYDHTRRRRWGGICPLDYLHGKISCISSGATSKLLTLFRKTLLFLISEFLSSSRCVFRNLCRKSSLKGPPSLLWMINKQQFPSSISISTSRTASYDNSIQLGLPHANSRLLGIGNARPGLIQVGGVESRTEKSPHRPSSIAIAPQFKRAVREPVCHVSI